MLGVSIKWKIHKSLITRDMKKDCWFLMWRQLDKFLINSTSQCFETDMVYFIRYIFYWNLQFLNHVIIIKTKILFPQT